MNEHIFSVYALSDPRMPDLFRYIGATVKPIKERLQAHMATARKRQDNPLRKWVESLLRCGLTPKITVLQTCGPCWVVDAEAFFIERARASGFLLNHAYRHPYTHTQYLT